jgi:asparagine synthase (glutamine-hydrolysing)
VVFNGEIYNYKELRHELEHRGHTFRTSSDTETIVHLYEDLGPACVDRLRGMFALAIWDERRQQVLLARDRLGIKPLYYAERNGELLFASELKPILQLRHVDRTLNWEAVGHLFTFLATSPDQSIVEGVKKLEPARRAVATRGSSLRVERYWDVRFEPDLRSTEEELVEQLRGLLVESVALHQVGDVPVGAFLSGGIDSSSVVATMSPLNRSRIKTFSVGFHEEAYNELGHAQRVAALHGTDHHHLVLEPDVVSMVEDLAWYLDEPFGDTSAIPTYMVSKLAAEHEKVVLTGDAGDEIFAGYDK